MRIYLIGMPGVGKTTVGKKLAEKLSYQFIDLDDYIEQKAMMFVDEIFSLYGEEYFRALEANCLDELTNNENVVIACGGGVIKNISNKAKMQGKCIYLKAPLAEVEDRLKNSGIIRPILETKTVKELYNERKFQYDYFKDLEINNLDLNETVEIIMKVVDENA